ncbi:MAG: hypothetical protein ACLFQV_04630 [Vulcanimicrobiota bacterium]
MKQTVQMQNIQDRMKPGIITLSGFLGEDGRNLIDILESDDAEVKRLGYTHEQIADKMKQLRDAAYEGLEEYFEIPPHFKVKVATFRGKLPCPFGDPGVHRKVITHVINTEKDQELFYTDLSIHMIKEHGFYQGRGSSYRIDPGKAAEVLELEPESV